MGKYGVVFIQLIPRILYIHVKNLDLGYGYVGLG
jgi:hypothetical protein